ncbi:MAG: biotin transporter BioY [Acutalibacteraceae bacterium]|nr:biotin transporter BioY [Acutalibacteraceae bacterium]
MKKIKIKSIIITALFSAILCILAPWSIAVSVIPITLSVFAIFLVGALLPPVKALCAALVYIILGAIGLPVFSNFAGGFGVLLGPTGGFILAYPVMCLCQSAIIGKEKRDVFWLVKNVVGMCVALVICYSFGSVYYMFVTEVSLKEAFAVCVIPFLVVDIIKLISAVAVTYGIFKSPLYNMLRK